MTSKTRKRSQAGRRDHEAPPNLTESGRKEPGEAPSPIAPNQAAKSKSGHSPTTSQIAKLHAEDSDSDETDGKAHLGKNKRPDLIGTRPCERFLSGHCNFGKDCWFVHDVEAREAIKAAGSAQGAANSVSSQLKLEDDPPKPKISLAPTNPWGRPIPEDDESETPDSIHSELGMAMSDSSTSLSQKRAYSITGQSNSSRNPGGSSLLPATPGTQPALGVFSVVDMLANVRSGLFEDAISRGVCISCAPTISRPDAQVAVSEASEI